MSRRIMAVVNAFVFGPLGLVSYSRHGNVPDRPFWKGKADATQHEGPDRSS